MAEQRNIHMQETVADSDNYNNGSKARRDVVCSGISVRKGAEGVLCCKELKMQPWLRGLTATKYGPMRT
jgi:hypothetical protein